MPRYFYSELASRPLTEGMMSIVFEPTGIIGGRLTGIFEAVNPAQERLLEQAIRSRVGITEISLEDYAKLKAQKKTPVNSTPLPDSTLPPVSPGPTLADRTGVESAGVPPEQELSSKKFLTPAECIVIGAVNSPDAFVEERDRMSPVTKVKRKRAA